MDGREKIQKELEIVVKLIVALIAVVGLSVVGCQKKTEQAAPSASGSVMDVSPSDGSYTPAPSYTPTTTTPTPAVSDAPSVTATPTSSANQYTIKKGDTLYSIARSHYGDGKQWKKIVDANPGLDPAKLKVGQTIELP